MSKATVGAMIGRGGGHTVLPMSVLGVESDSGGYDWPRSRSHSCINFVPQTASRPCQWGRRRDCYSCRGSNTNSKCWHSRRRRNWYSSFPSPPLYIYIYMYIYTAHTRTPRLTVSSHTRQSQWHERAHCSLLTAHCSLLTAHRSLHVLNRR